MQISVLSSIRFRLFLMLFLGVFSIAFIGGLGVLGMYYTSHSLEEMYVKRVVPLRDFKVLTENYGYKVQNAVISMNNGEMTADEGLDSIRNALVSVQQAWERLKSQGLERHDEKTIAYLEELMFSANMEIEGIIRLIEIFRDQGDRLLANRLGMIIGSLHPKVQPILSRIELFSAQAEDRARQAYQEAIWRHQRNQVLISIIVLLFLVSGLALGYRTRKKITGQIAEILPVLRRMGAGDLEGSIEVRSGTELGLIARGINEMALSLRRLVAAIGSDSVKLDQMAGQLRENARQGLKNMQSAAGGIKDVVTLSRESAHSMEELIRVSDDLLQELITQCRPPLIHKLTNQMRDGLLALRNGKLIAISSRCAEVRNDAVLAARVIHHVANRAAELQSVAEHQAGLARGFYRSQTNKK